ncbi:Os03g0346750 [Oryza sativa Japonica Group]|uniref:Os03g0346750 protein n=1 Tax=Oryza sativa subsp. japonica TaxID=39947 RepID=A0A0P0VXF9_ORYSJ|nr:hypothetical protein EE612_017371 [Oryza sativa]BAS84165.1 Os03g0346750 [Oryza sativa Japonica Group]
MAGCGRCRPRRRAAGNQPRRAPPDQLLPSQGTTNQSAPSTPWIYPKLERVPEPNSPPRCARRQHCPWAARGPAASSVAAAAAAAAPAPPRTPAPPRPCRRWASRPPSAQAGSCPARRRRRRRTCGGRPGARRRRRASWPGRSASRRRSCRAWRARCIATACRRSACTAAPPARRPPPPPPPSPSPHRGIARGGEGGGGERKPGRGKSVGGRRVIE